MLEMSKDREVINKQAVTAFLEQVQPSDLKEFQELFCGKIKPLNAQLRLAT